MEWLENYAYIYIYMGDNIKMDVKETGLELWTGLIWLRVGTCGRLL
jgi:hypothetical protein